MVALKLVRRDSSSAHPGLKQERRGGIETISRPRGVHDQIMKQERRGGIETGLAGAKSCEGSQEAGTPWWH